MRRISTLAICVTCLTSQSLGQPASGVEQALLAEDSSSLAQAARQQGDAQRGAVVFHQPQMACARCHAVGGKETSLGPDLTKLEQPASDEHLVESVLRPSKVIRKGYEPLAVLTADGRIITGLRVDSREDGVALRDPSTGRVLRFGPADIEQQTVSDTSIMPAGQVNQLASRQQFLDLIRYLIEIRDGGAARARQLQPPASLYVLKLPEYESRVDHAGLLADLDHQAFERGAAIYNRLCVNCHGTVAQPGSLPTALRFAEGKFKSGSDPLTMYQTLTRGFGFMAGQTWMVPRQKYDVIHYIREAYLRPHNPSQYFPVDDAYLAALPQGDTRGPKPVKYEPWSTMDYGPSLVGTYEVPSAPDTDGSENFAYKGIAVRLDPGPGGVARGNAWMIFDHDTMRVAAAWTTPLGQAPQRFIDWEGILFNGHHAVHPHVVGDVHFSNPTGPGWAHPRTGSFTDDQRIIGRDGKRYGPLPHEWARFDGFYAYEDKTIIKYAVGGADILEMPGLLTLGRSSNPSDPDAPEVSVVGSDGLEIRPRESHVFTRTFNVGPRDQDLTLLVATHPHPAPRLHRTDAEIAVLTPLDGDADVAIVAGISQAIPGLHWHAHGPRLMLTLPAGEEPLRFVLWTVRHPIADGGVDDGPLNNLASRIASDDPAPDLSMLTRGGRPRWPEKVTTQAVIGDDAGSFAVDVLTTPWPNPWLARTRLTGLDFFPDGDRMAVCAWDGDVWIVEGIGTLRNDDGVRRGSRVRRSSPVRRGSPDPAAEDDRRSLRTSGRPAVAGVSRSGDRDITARNDESELRWRRIASGLFQPLGLKIVDGEIYVTCRDQIVILRDLNGDGETDFYECFNDDHQVTEHFHEFAMGLQVDEAGNFYYAKSARHALPAIVPHHGTLLRVCPDGSKTDILATGFRAANGVCVNADGTFIVTDQEGHWNPKNRINWVHEGGFYGNMLGYHDVTDESDDAMEQPLCWITNAFDRSPAELLWVESEKWGPLNGSLLNLSYGYGKVYVVPFEEVAGHKQGGMCALPIPQFPTGIIRGRFHPPRAVSSHPSGRSESDPLAQTRSEQSGPAGPEDGQLYLCGLFAWAGSQQDEEGGLYRLRYTGKPAHLPVGLKATQTGMTLTFTDPLEPTSAEAAGNYAVKIWSLKRTAEYGSEHYNERPLEVTGARLSVDGRTVELVLPEIQPTWCMEIRYSLKAASGEPFDGVIHNTVHAVSDAP